MNHLLRSRATISDAGWELVDGEARERLTPALAARKLVDFSGPLVELRADFQVSRAELRDADRGAVDADLEALDWAAHQIAVAENVAVFHGWEGAITGIAEASPHDPMQLGDAAEGYPRQVAGAVERLLCSGVAGPYGLALGREQYRRVVETAEHGGYPLLDHLRKILEGPIVWAPGVTGAVVLSLRGGDFIFESGQDHSVGYDSHDSEVNSALLEFLAG